MNLQNIIIGDMRTSIKSGDAELKSALRVIVGEFQRQTSAELSDDEVIKVLRKLVKAEQEMLEMTRQSSSRFLEVAVKYIPALATEDEIKTWIRQNIDFSKFKNKILAMKDVLAHFGARTDGNTVKKILTADI